MDNTDLKKIFDEFYRKIGFENNKKAVELNPTDKAIGEDEQATICDEKAFTEALTKKLLSKRQAKAELEESIRAYHKLLELDNEDG